ncbi:MAG: DUF882 domain-containing protein [Deltaproteobacteria bacterium]|nr:MAG: DUF882 domain-containing protein [Deltaproteobacteria bacterium]
MPTRRHFLQLGVAASALFLAPWNAWAKVGRIITELPERSVNLYNVNTGEMLSRFVYWQDGNYLKGALDEISYLLRDHRTDEVKLIDPTVIDQIFSLGIVFEALRPFEVISGYRSVETNQELRHRSRRVARRSLHVEGKAIDLRLPGVPVRQLRTAALSLRDGGVGYYPRKGFVHIDSGPVRQW